MADIKVRSEVAGSVWKIEKQIGDAIAGGDTIMIIESMKMEIPVICEDSGTLTAIHVKEGDAVAEGGVVATVKG
jgi:acetyl-CoA carboxylase biotin carboxyl carrier protein